MDHLEVPTKEVWESRREWYESHIFHYEELGSYIVGEQASALLCDVQSCFCAGSWVSVILVAYSVIEAQLRENDPNSDKKQSYILLRENSWENEVTNLRKIRNRLVHAKFDAPVITIDDQWDNRDDLEKKAREAISLMFKVFYSDSGT